ncbi:class I SAM-dependent methyltransferase [Salinibacter sp.]|uniref:class I SAM-dependent methyltransferase n=1 Tax=Salinibacter sp. TaxID=2065818 RepID=UPI0021E7A8BB|nr:class I SAM-dependent methyltransferase [Salinibacter sp.]
MAKYSYSDSDIWRENSSVRDAIRRSVFRYCKGQLGWSNDGCEARVEKEMSREIPKSLFDSQKQRWGWTLSEAKLLDVGAGQGAGVLEALLRGADAYGIEPGREFAELSRLRVEEKGFDPERISQVGGEALPYPNDYFDYAISLQVLEHVKDPYPILSEIFRVLKPGGEVHIRCENYLAFQEQHYRLPWFPLLPKKLGSLYLKTLGRDPSFLKEYVFYSTYPQIVRIVRSIGFKNLTLERKVGKLKDKESIRRKSAKTIAYAIDQFPRSLSKKITKGLLHLSKVFATGVRLQLRKPR